MKIASFCILGRANVGKSTFFNCLSQKKTITKDEEGVTRDCNKILVEYQDYFFFLIDTGGLVLQKQNSMQQKIKKQIDKVVAESDAIFFLVDAREGWQFEDQRILLFIQKTKKKYFLLANKVDSTKQDDLVLQFYNTGIKDIYSISAEHNLGIGDFLEELAKQFTISIPPVQVRPDELAISIIGKTNVGKSSLLNLWLGEERMIVENKAHTTRNAVSFELVYKNTNILLMDTAGIAKKNKIAKLSLERLMVVSALQTLKWAKIAILVIDVNQGISEQDLKLADLILEKKKSLILVFNKWDLMTEEKNNKKKLEQKIKDYIHQKHSFLDFCPLVFSSAKTKKNIFSILDKTIQVAKDREKKIPTADLNQIVERIQTRNIAPVQDKKKLKIFYATQIRWDPPIFSFFVNDKKLVTKNYEKFVKNQFRHYLGFEGTPMQLFWRNK